MPQSDGVDPSQPGRLVAPGDSHLLLDRLEPSRETEAPKRMEQVHVDQVQAESGERLPEEGQVEPGPVERDEQLRRADRGGQRLQVLSLDEGAFPPAIVDANEIGRASCRERVT